MNMKYIGQFYKSNYGVTSDNHIDYFLLTRLTVTKRRGFVALIRIHCCSNNDCKNLAEAQKQVEVDDITTITDDEWKQISEGKKYEYVGDSFIDVVKDMQIDKL